MKTSYTSSRIQVWVTNDMTPASALAEVSPTTSVSTARPMTLSYHFPQCIVSVYIYYIHVHINKYIVHIYIHI